MLGIDTCEASISTYKKNLPYSSVMHADITRLTASSIKKRIGKIENLVVAGCPPCQLFSRLQRSSAPVGTEIDRYSRLINKLDPICVLFENVPEIVHRKEAWGMLLHRLDRYGYHVKYGVVSALDFGVPQHRNRLILIASKIPIDLPKGNATEVATVRHAIGHLPETDPTIPNHITMKLSAVNLDRIRRLQSSEDKTREMGTPFYDSYTRMNWDKPAPTMTTKCISFSNGRFGHPQFNRAITVREAAHLQGFPSDFVFVGNLTQTARQVGNAVPPPVARAVGRQILMALGSTKS